MLMDRSHRPWMYFSLTALILTGAWYTWYSLHAMNGPSGASLPGLIFGIAGTALMFFAGSLSVRRRLRSWRLGRAQTWLRAHLWLGALSLPLIWFHGGFRHGGPLTTVMMYLLYAVFVSGVVGLVIQYFLPGKMTTDVPNETFFTRLPQVLKSRVLQGRELVTRYGGAPVTDKSAALLEGFFIRQVQPYLELRPSELRDQQLSGEFKKARMELPPSAQATIDQLEKICHEARQLRAQQRLHWVLHGWLFVHVPLSMALLLLTVFHIVMALRFSF